jgi:hypothetical protein
MKIIERLIALYFPSHKLLPREAEKSFCTGCAVGAAVFAVPHQWLFPPPGRSLFISSIDIDEYG